MDRRVDVPTTRIVGPIRRRDQREEHHTRAAMGELGPRGHPAQEWLYYKVPGDRSRRTIPKVID